MSSDATAGSVADPSPKDLYELQAKVETFEAELSDLRSDVENGHKKMVIIATKRMLDMAYPPLILASTAAAFGYNVTVFHTFWGLEILHERNSKNLELSSVGNPSMPVSNAIAALPGMAQVTARMMQNKIKDNEVASIEELIVVSLESSVGAASAF